MCLLPLDVKKEYRETFQSATIDDILKLLETNKIDLIPIQNIDVVYNKDQCRETADFVQWIMNEGVSFNHNYGFLRPDEETLNLQQQHIQRNYLTSTSK